LKGDDPTIACSAHHQIAMSDEEEYYYDESEEEVEGEEEVKEVVDEMDDDEHGEIDEENRHETLTARSGISEGEAKLLARNEAKKGELNEQLREVINEWRKNRAKEEEELQRLKELQARRKEVRAEQEKKLAEQKREEEEKIRKDEAEKKNREAEEKRKRLEEAEKKRQAMVLAQKNKKHNENGSLECKKGLGGFESIQDAKREKVKTKEQLAEEKRISLSIRIKQLELDDLGKDGLRAKSLELWDNVVRLETEKYDLEERQRRQGYDLKELSERQTQRLRLKAVRMGLDAEALTGKYPPKIQTASKFERRADNKTYDDKKTLFDGGWETITGEMLEKEWKERMGQWNKQQRAKLPKWFGVRPGRRSDDPQTPDDGKVESQDDADDLENIGNIEDLDVAGSEEEEEEEEEEYEEEEEEDDYE